MIFLLKTTTGHLLYRVLRDVESILYFIHASTAFLLRLASFTSMITSPLRLTTFTLD